MPITDLHSHLIPAVDDGAQTDDEARNALAAMREAGVGTIITTPHVDASLVRRPALWDQRLAALDDGWRRLSTLAEREFADLSLHRGAELKLDTPEPRVDDDRVRLAGGRFVLVEFPFMTVPPRSVPVIEGLRAADMIPIIAHPERYSGLDADLELPGAWRRAGAYLQVNTGSVAGRYGKSAERVALSLLERGQVDYLSSDYHARGALTIREARRSLLEHGATQEVVTLLTEANPARVLDDESPLPVPRIEPKPGLWARITARLN